MGKKKAIQILSGSLKTHWIKYISVLNLQPNPTDRYGMGTTFRIIRILNTIDQRYLQPGFKYNLNFVIDKGFYYPSIMNVKFVNGYERNYDLKMSHYDFIQHEIGIINNQVEFERSMGGQDDEMDDETQ